MRRIEIDPTKIYQSNCSGEYRIIRSIPREKGNKGSRMVEIEFIKTGYKSIVTLYCALNGKVKDKYNFKGISIDTDKIFESNNSGKFKIIKEMNKNIHGNRMVLIEFVSTGNRYEVPLSNATRGAVKDKDNYKNTHIDYNKIYNSNNYGQYKIIEDAGTDNNFNRRVIIKFIKTGYESNVNLACALDGNVKDVYYPSIYGVGCFGEPDTSNPYYRELYKVWLRMIRRCYDTTAVNYKDYGGAGITVDKEWHCFANFLMDAQALPNFEYKIMYPSDYHLDKDYLQQNVPTNQKVYSKNTCVWLYSKDNILLRNLSHDNNYNGQYKNAVTTGDLDTLIKVYNEGINQSLIIPVRIVKQDPTSKLLDFINSFNL